MPHRQVVLTLSKRLPAYCLYRRRLLGEIARVAAHTVTAAIRTLTGEREISRSASLPACRPMARAPSGSRTSTCSSATAGFGPTGPSHSAALGPRGHPPLGGTPAADLRGRPAPVPPVPGHHADRGVHHPGGGDRSDPDAPPRRRHRTRCPPSTRAPSVRDRAPLGRPRPAARLTGRPTR